MDDIASADVNREALPHLSAGREPSTPAPADRKATKRPDAEPSHDRQRQIGSVGLQAADEKAARCGRRNGLTTAKVGHLPPTQTH